MRSAVMNRFEVRNAEVLDSAVERPVTVPLITVANHHSCWDDPGLWSCLPLRKLCDPAVMRWTLAAHNICFSHPIHSHFFSRGKCVPVIRGDGVFQRGVDFCVEQLNRGAWVHVFPEGRVNMDKQFIRFKWGVGRLIDECLTPPIIIPMWHIGMDDVVPNIKPYIPRAGKKVLVNFGQPLDLTPVIRDLRQNGANSVQRRKTITDEIQHRLLELKRETESLYQQSQTL